MNSRNSVNETNLVNFSADLTSLNPLDTKEPLLSFPFDHIYACHSESTDRRPTLQLDKEVEISTHCVVSEDKNLAERLASLENQNKKLKDLLLYHLDLIQQQNDFITKREKVYQSLKQENEALKSKVNRVDKKVTVAGVRSNLNTAAVAGPSSTVTSTQSDVPTSSSSVFFNSLTELLLPDKRRQYLLNNNGGKTKPLGQDAFELLRSQEQETEQSLFMQSDTLGTILDPGVPCDEEYEMIEHKQPVPKKEPIPETMPEPRYTVTTNSGNPVIQRIPRNRKKPTGIGSLSRLPKVQPKPEPVETNTVVSYDEDKLFSVNKKSKMINTYGKSKVGTSKYSYTGSLSDRLQLIDTTPTGEDPYQLGEAEMREQSPIPKLMLQKTNHGRMKICSDTMSGVTSTTTSTTSKRRVYDTISDGSNKSKLGKCGLTNSRNKKETIRTPMVEEPDLDIVKTETEIDWRIYPGTNPVKEISVCDFSYGETPANIKTEILPMDDQDFYMVDSAPAESAIAEIPPSTDKTGNEKTKKRGARTSSLAGPNEDGTESRRGSDTKRRKRALSTASTKKETAQRGGNKPKLNKSRAGNRGKKSPVPGMTTKEPFYTLLGDPDLSWYLGLDPDVKKEDVEQISEPKASNVEVPRWREKVYTSLYSLEGTENLDDKVFEKRHQKLEAEERRQLRWHMRRVREQRHVERLRQRQRDPWGPSPSTATTTPQNYTVWPQPLRDLKFIEITDTLPVSAFGEDVPALTDMSFVLPWVRTSKAQKRSKRSRTLH